jgi:hypothetical protein
MNESAGGHPVYRVCTWCSESGVLSRRLGARRASRVELSRRKAPRLLGV